jgi:hypothetical protein
MEKVYANQLSTATVYENSFERLVRNTSTKAQRNTDILFFYLKMNCKFHTMTKNDGRSFNACEKPCEKAEERVCGGGSD